MRLFRCEVCGNLVELINDGGGTLVCCGQDMIELPINKEETTFEKHLPVITKDGLKVSVEVGSITHPMTDQHYIEWIVLAEANKVQKVLLQPNDKPEAQFEVTSEDFTVYVYCNIHGFYKAN